MARSASIRSGRRRLRQPFPGVRRQRGVALLIVLLAILLAAGYAGLRGLNSAYAKSERDVRTLAAMQQAKQALLGYAASRGKLLGLNPIATTASRDVPGSLPCPAANFNYLDGLGVAQEYGRARETCTTPATRIGRLPWRTLETPELADAAGEPLWYAVSGPFRQQTTGSPRLNLASSGAIRFAWCGTISRERIVAVIIAPGLPLPSQVRGTAAERDDPFGYLERFVVAPAGADFEFFPGTHTSEAPAFNDFILTITEEELFDAMDNALAARIERDIPPILEAHKT